MPFLVQIEQLQLDKLVWAELEAMRDGAAIASKQVWS